MKTIIVKKKLCLAIIRVFCSLSINAHTPDSIRGRSHLEDSVFSLQDVEIVGYVRPQFRLQTPASVGIINTKELQTQSVTSMLPAMNTVPGVRMEERSPGSYRLSIRGSLVRSPYGVRNVKMYYNDFALTDAGGNTYLNALNVNDMAGIEILKGPDGSLFGANSGGVVFLKSNTDRVPALQVNAYGGSRGLFGESFYLARQSGDHFWTLRQSYQRADGYRNNTHNRRFFVQASDQWRYRPTNVLEAYLFYSDISYGTPGALTQEQFDEDPRQSRPATATMPGSAEQKTGVTTKMFFGGIRHKAKILPYLDHTISLWGSYVDFTNSFITNYETRKETNLGLRTFFSLVNPDEEHNDWKPSFDVGFEGQRLVTDIHNYDNHAGVAGDLQAYNDILNHQSFGFVRGRLNWRNRLTIQAAVSVNFNGYHFRDTTNIKNNFRPVWMPHLAISYKVIEPLFLRFTLSKGYSTPTTAEVRPADNKIYKDLQPEKGWNTEFGFRLNLLRGRLMLDASCFHYELHDGIISQVDSIGNTYFVNSGRIRQFGVEVAASWHILTPVNAGNRFFKGIRWNSNYTYSNFRYDSYVTGKADYTGNRVAGVPRNTVVNNFYFTLPSDFYFFVQHNYTSRIPVNDANSVYANDYHILSARVGYEPGGGSFRPSRIYLAGDNLLNQKYSLGNDLNAMGGRYFNAAPDINFQVGVMWEF